MHRMARFGLAWRAFWRTLRDEEFAEQVQQAFEGAGQAALPPAAAPQPPPPDKPPVRSDALALLSALQREGRLLDFLHEPLQEYSDEQVGAAVRDVHRDCRAVVERMFAPQPLRREAEGSAIDVPEGFDAASYRLTGNVTGRPPYRGALCHHGWEATRCEVPAWTGGAASARVLAPAEVEL
jgi:hypothetical protein